MAGKHERAVHFYKTYLRYVPKAPNRADIEEKIKTGEQLAAQQAAGTLPPPTTTTPPPVTTTPPPGADDAAARQRAGHRPDAARRAAARRDAPARLHAARRPRPPIDPGRKFRIAGLISAGAGGVMYLLALIQWSRAASASSQIEADARAGLAFNPATQEKGQSAEAQQAFWFVLGTLAIGAGAGVWYYGHRLGQTIGDDHLADRARALRRAESGRRHPPDHLLTMRTCLSRVLLAAALSAAAASACGYSPNIPSGTLVCGPQDSCPEDYTCVSGTCWRAGDASAAVRLLGYWTFDAPPSRRVIACTDGTSFDDPWTDYFVVEEGGSATLRAFYYCDLDLNISASGSTVLVLGRTCSANDTLDPTVSYTWTPQSFTLSSADGSNATLSASIPYIKETPLGTYSCTMDFTGTLTKS